MRLRTQLISGTALLLVTAYPAAAQSQFTIKPWTGKAVILAQSSECVQDPTAEGCADAVTPKDEPAQNADENAAKPAEPKAEEPANAAEGGKKNAEKAAKKAREKLPETDTQKTDGADEQQAEKEQPVEEPDSNKTELSSETTGESEIEAESETSVESETAVESETSGEAEASSESETIIESETSAETDASTDTDTSAGTDTDTETSGDTETATDSETIVEQESDSDTETTVESETTSEETIETTSEEETDERDQSASEESDSDAERAPVLDSMKKGKRNREDTAGTDEGQTQDDSQQASDKSSEPPTSDAEAQAEIDTDVESATEEEGRRVERPRDRDRRRDRGDDEEVVRDMGDRIIIRFGDTFHVEWRDRDERIRRGAEEVYYEELPRGRTREVVVRRNGVKVVTIRNRHGDILHRAKIFPDGREIVLVHVDRDHYDRVRDRHRHDHDYGLPPLRLTIPISEYVLEAELVDDPDVYYQFLSRPPVETVERTYSIAEVTESPRIRDKVRRVDLDTINFEFGSARIADSEIDELDGIARAMKRMLDQNPGETFLIEGHTDAVGSDMVNLALSDRRAEAVVAALTEFYEIPPENLVPQGYGEQYLKVNTEDRSRENRRVAIRRITPLVAPVASTN